MDLTAASMNRGLSTFVIQMSASDNDGYSEFEVDTVLFPYLVLFRVRFSCGFD